MDTMEEHATAESALLDEYSGILEQISETPYQRALHLQHIDITKKLGLPLELDGAREMMSSYWPLSEAMWLEWIAERKAQLPQSPVEDLTPHMELMELYKRAVAEYLSIPLLVSYSQFAIRSHYVSQGLSAPVEVTDEDEPMEDVERKVGEADEILGALFGLESVRGVCKEVLEIGEMHLVESQSLWNVWRAFEMDLLKLNPGPEQVAQVDALYLARLCVPHLELESTFSEYSSFITRFDNGHYDTKLPAANKLYSNAKKTLDLREPEEAKLKKAAHADWAYLEYTNWELSVPRPDHKLVKALFERAIKDFPSSVEMWDAYLEFANTMPKKQSVLLEVAERAIKHLPESGRLWAAYLRAAEKNQQGSDVVEGLFQRAMSTGLLDGSMDDLVALYEGRAGFHRREVDQVITNADDMEPDMIDLVVAILEEGIEKILDISKRGDGDPQLRLEKHLLRQLERFGRNDEASRLWEELTDANSRSYAVWYGRADFETRIGRFRKAHEVYIAGCAARFLDYPEYLLEAWLSFEKQNGTLSDLEFTLTKVKRQQKRIAARRQTEGMAAAAAEPVASTSATTDSFITSAVQGEGDSGKKRERSPAPVEAAPSKKVKFEPASDEVKRDRENSTVFVIGEAGTQFSEEDLKKLFSDCGAIRECKLKTIDNQAFAMIEFMDRETVLAARTKDKKKINGVEVQVSIAWQSCLYITNFPEVFDKAAIETLFSKYGLIFDTRWPSKRFKNTRRFCYVQFTATADAQAALALHNTELEPGLKLTVYVSDPGRKKGRTDAGANQRELFVGGLSKFVSELDLKRLFEPFGAVKGIRLNLDDKGECKGYAFVEFEDEASAQASLTLNNHELKKRRMSVTIAQPRATGTTRPPHEAVRERKVDVEARSVRVRGIAPGTEEAIVQQAFAKHAVIKLVTMEVGATEAVVELESAAEARRLLLIKDTITIDGALVEIIQEGPAARLVPGKAYEDPKGSAPLLPRNTGRSRGRVGLGGRGGRGRSGIGAAGVAALQAVGAGAAASRGGEVVASTSGAGGAGGKSQDDFRALLSKKA